MQNFERYQNPSEAKYNKKGISYFLMRRNADKIIYPYLGEISGENILEVGIGYGYYKSAYFTNNHVTGYDINPFLGKDLGIEIISGKAGEIRQVGRKFNRILSFFMTEYLNMEDLSKFINDSVAYLLEENGVFATTVIVDYGLGALYTRLARIKGIKKYSYKYNDIKRMLTDKNYRMIPLNSYLGIPLAVLIEIKNER